MRDIGWSPEGLKAVPAAGLRLDEVIEAACSPDRRRLERFGVVTTVGTTDAGRLLVVFARRVAPEVQLYLIFDAREAGPAERRWWMEES